MPTKLSKLGLHGVPEKEKRCVFSSLHSSRIDASKINPQLQLLAISQHPHLPNSLSGGGLTWCQEIYDDIG
ncbi:unnamed protein product [Onchocerca flexuosa]|uniref:Ovule protein n=1 Tax=Onchocerca flexuosa TaxID=387005 RepID=A0A183HZG3_9BILA|nr:unnamed protein product [Onchocerca flexuosa]